MTEKADVVLETFKPGYMASLGLGYEDLKESNPRLIVCSLTDFGQTGPWKDYKASDLLHMAAGGQMAKCGYDDDDVPNAPPIAPGGGQAWHMGSHFACIAIMAALNRRTSSGKGQCIDASVHDACALTTEMHVNIYIYTGKVAPRTTGRGGGINVTPKAQHLCKDGKYVNAGILNRLSPAQLKVLAEWMDGYGLAGDLSDEKYSDSAVITENRSHINGMLTNFFGSITRDEAYHGGQKRGFNMGAIRSPDEVMEDPHLEDRGFWADVEYPEIGKTFRHPGPAGIFNGSPWQISRRAPLVGEHNEEILCGELNLSRAELAVLAEAGAV
jgi:crotonobetainyl-CoA:carnitine CoA-transferase CaiB-like acyl-CoA transferase